MDDDVAQLPGVDGADRCWFWSGEQNRWVDVISAWIIEHDPFALPPNVHTVTRGMSTMAQGDVCMPTSMEPVIEVSVGAKTGRIAVKVDMSAVLWKELSTGWDVFVTEVHKMVLLRCGLQMYSPPHFSPTSSAGCKTCVDKCSTSWGYALLCGVHKVPVPVVPPIVIQVESE